MTDLIRRVREATKKPEVGQTLLVRGVEMTIRRVRKFAVDVEAPDGKWYRVSGLLTINPKEIEPGV